MALEPPRVRRRQTIAPLGLARHRPPLAIRHVSGHRLVAMLEIVSPANKDRESSVQDFAAKVTDALDRGVHVLVVDLFPPGRFDPQGVHGVVKQRLENSDEPYDLPAAEPLTLASYVAGPRVEIYLEHLATGNTLPEMPLFLRRIVTSTCPLKPPTRKPTAASRRMARRSGRQAGTGNLIGRGSPTVALLQSQGRMSTISRTGSGHLDQVNWYVDSSGAGT